MKIKSVRPFILHVPVTGAQIADSTHAISHWGVVGAEIETQNGLIGYGFTGTPNCPAAAWAQYRQATV